MRKKLALRFLALLCLLGLLLTGCDLNLKSLTSWPEDTEPVETEEETRSLFDDIHALTPEFSDMEYERPDMDEFDAMVFDLCEAAENPKSPRQLRDLFWDVYDFYETFYTMEALAEIRYSINLRDSDYEEEYAYCMEQSASVGQGVEDCIRAMAASEFADTLESEDYFGEGFFDDYRGDAFYTPELTALLERENALISDSYAVMSDLNEFEYYSDAYFDKAVPAMGELLVELIHCRQEIAEYLGYDSYGAFAFEYYHDRDYTVETAEEYLDRIQQELVPLYRALNQSGGWTDTSGRWYARSRCKAYLDDVTENMGGALREAYNFMDEKELFDIAPSRNKYTGSFEIYLRSYNAPFLFMNPSEDGSDCLTLAHEFGHYANDYFVGGTYASKDVLEFFSQGLEYLSLFYNREGKDFQDTLRYYKLSDSLDTYVEQAAFARFETEIYSLPEEEVTVERLGEIYEEVCRSYGFDSWNWDSRDWVTVTHFFNAPYYILSYVTSNDIAMQLYEMEQAKSGSGLRLYEEYLSGSEATLMAFVEETGLQSPFAEERLEEVCAFFQTELELKEVLLAS